MELMNRQKIYKQVKDKWLAVSELLRRKGDWCGVNGFNVGRKRKKAQRKTSEAQSEIAFQR